MRKKNQIPKYLASSLVKMIKKISEQSIDKKPPNLVKYYGKKPKDL